MAFQSFLTLSTEGQRRQDEARAHDKRLKELRRRSLGRPRLFGPRSRDLQYVPELIEAINSEPDRRKRRELVTTLAKLQSTDALQTLIAEAQHHDEQIRFYAIKGLANLGDPAAIAVLVHAVRSERRQRLNVFQAARALHKIGDPSVISVLQEVEARPSTVPIIKMRLRSYISDLEQTNRSVAGPSDTRAG